MSRVTAIISALVIRIIVCLFILLIITVITPLPTKPSATKMPENWKLANAAITDMQMRQRDVAALDAKDTKELADAKAENDACVMIQRPLSSVAHQSSSSVSVKLPPPPAWIMQLPDWQTPLNGIISPRRERLITMCKTTEGTQKYINIVDRVAHIDGQLMQLL